VLKDQALLSQRNLQSVEVSGKWPNRGERKVQVRLLLLTGLGVETVPFHGVENPKNTMWDRRDVLLPGLANCLSKFEAKVGPIS
jgi:hypothetical protein